MGREGGWGGHPARGGARVVEEPSWVAGRRGAGVVLCSVACLPCPDNEGGDAANALRWQPGGVRGFLGTSFASGQCGVQFSVIHEDGSKLRKKMLLGCPQTWPSL